MESASSSPQPENRSISPSKDEVLELKVNNSGSPIRGTFKKGIDSGFNDVQICSSLNKTAAVMSSMLMTANSVRAAACEGECGYVLSEKGKKMACDALIESKKSFVELIHGELKAVDEDYHRMFRQQTKDVDMLVISMGTQADKKIHEEQLGWVWCPPPKDIFLSFGSFISYEKKGQAKDVQIESVSCRGIEEDMLALRLSDQSNGDDSTDQDSVRSSQNDLANYENKSADLPSIPEIDRIWRSYSELIAPKVLHVWASLAAALVSYNQLLKNRYYG